MAFFDTLSKETESARIELLATPIIERSLRREISMDDYVGFLVQAYHHVKHTTPLLMALGARLPETKEWLRVAVAEYIDEELGHQEWILNDIASCGYDKEFVRQTRP
ncbi:MAG: iron-containing redox enzyme family protein, partial [Gammaproteobacteria bacterium]|nr:iron-containing redox enzyme family protein [Gammaproteobacteria bacterium]